MNESPLPMNLPKPEKSHQEKALWYREVLSIDPASRIFLPYARLLMEHGRSCEAMDILRSGLAKHPEFLEARLFFIDVLCSLGEEKAAALEAAPLIEALSHCSSLWKVWSMRSDIRADQAAMLLFFGTTFKEGGPSMLDVFRAGISSLSMGNAAADAMAKNKQDAALPPQDEKQHPHETPQNPAHAAPAPQTVKDGACACPNAGQAAPSPHAPCFVMSENTPWYSLDSVPDDDDVMDDGDVDDGESAKPAPVISPAMQNLFPPEMQAEKTRLREQDYSSALSAQSPLEGKSSLCTRSMACILEEQGAMAEAAGIYRELLKNSASDEERAELKAKLDSLRQREEIASPASSGIINMLETLAVRLENKSRA